MAHCFRISICKLHHLGRETILLPLTWNNAGWPVINGCGWMKDTSEIDPIVDGCRQIEEKQWSDALKNGWRMEWCRLRNPEEDHYIRTPEGVALSPGSCTLDDIGSPVWLGVRQRSFDARVSVCMDAEPAPGLKAGLGVFQTNEHHYEIVCEYDKG